MLRGINQVSSRLKEAMDKVIQHNLSYDQSTDVVKEFIRALEAGDICPVFYADNQWQVNTWVREGLKILFSKPCRAISAQSVQWWDKIALQNTSHSTQWQSLGRRFVPGAWVREACHIGDSSVIMNSFINVGAHVGAETLIDSYAVVGSCAYVGKRCHVGANVTLGGVLEPVSAKPVIIEDECFIGAGSQVVEGRVIGKGSVLGAGVVLTSSTKIFDRMSGMMYEGDIPPYSVVIPGHVALPDMPQVTVGCAVITKTVDAKTRDKTAINDLLRP